MKKHLLSLVLLSFVLLNLSCKKSPTEIDKPPIPPTPPSLELSVDGVSCTEAWIKVKKLNDTTFLPISVKINEKEFFHGFLAATDTVLFVDSLIPNTTYTVKGIILDTLQTAEELKVTTLPTTSHNFTWQIFEFGEHSSSVLYDVAIIDENNIWVVGEIYINDSLGIPDSQRYNALHWDGNRWEIKRIPYNYEGTNYYHPIQSVFAFGANDIWFCGNGVIHWNGSNFLPISISTDVWGSYLMNKIWGTNSNDLYAVGKGGNIAHYDGKNWLKIESGTTLNIHDIWGDYNEKTKNWEILCIASDALDGSIKSKKLLSLTNVSAIAVEDSGLTWNLMSIWFKAGRKYYLGGKGLFSTMRLGIDWKQDNSISNYILSISGQDVNDIVIGGGYNLLSHYNGQEWKHFKNNGIPNININFARVKLSQNITVALGFDGWKAILVIGKR